MSSKAHFFSHNQISTLLSFFFFNDPPPPEISPLPPPAPLPSCPPPPGPRHEDPVLEKPQNGYRDASARVWKKVALSGRLEPGAPRAPLVAATSARSYLASEGSIQCSSGGIACELRAKWMGAPAAPAPTVN